MSEIVVDATPVARSRRQYDLQSRPGTSFEVKKDSKGRVLNPEVISMTNQSDADACDINKIFARFEKTGLLMDPSSGVMRTPQYGDFTELGDFHDMKIRVAQAEQAFDQLPAKIKNRFDNDVQKLYGFLADQKNWKEAVALNLMDPEMLKQLPADPPAKEPVPEKERVVPPGTGAQA